MTDSEIITGYFQGVFWAYLGLSMISCNATEESLDAAKITAEKMNEQRIDTLTLSKEEKDRMKADWKAWSESALKGFKDTLKKEGRLVGRQ